MPTLNRTPKPIQIPLPIEGATVEIPLTRGYVAIVDAIDADLMQYKWVPFVTKSGNTYARRFRRKADIEGNQWVHIHRVILERKLGRALSAKEYVDHWNGNGLDNTRKNLRLASRLQNTMNTRVRCTSKSIYKGVNYRKDSGKWRSRIDVDNKRISLGNFSTAEEAACVYNHYALRYFGQFAWLNDIENWQIKAGNLLEVGTRE